METKFLPGALPDSYIHQLMNERFIKNALPENVKPSSLDLRIDLKTLVEIPCVFLPSKNKMTIAETLHHLDAKPVYESGNTILEVGRTYVAQVIEQVNLSQTAGLFARANPKSSTGRSDIHVQLLADYVPAYDTVPVKWNGKLYVLLRARSFPILFTTDVVSLNQIRFFQDERVLVSGETLRGIVAGGIIKNTHHDIPLQFSDIIRGGNRIELSLDLRDLGEVPGYVAKKNVTKPLVWGKGANDWQDFFEPISKILDDKAMIFEEDRFYILSSRESVHIPRDYACEMVSFDDTLGEFRSHYAGFIDNGWGEKGHRPLTLELRTNENMYMYHGQPVAYIVLDQMCAPVIKSYDEIDSNYTDQATARLGKFFK
jgi:dCTP deaminase